MLASWLARITARYAAHYRTFTGLFLKSGVSHNLAQDLQPNLDILRELGAIPTEEEVEIATKHSVIGATAIFYQESDWRSSIGRRNWHQGDSLHQNLKLNHPYWRFCPECRRHEEATGFLTWQRNAQLPGVRYCGRHHVPLMESQLHGIRSCHPPSSSESSHAVSLAVPGNQEGSHLQLAADLEDALALPQPNLGSHGIEQRLVRLLHDNGLKGRTVSLPWGKIHWQLTQCFGADFLAESYRSKAIDPEAIATSIRRPRKDSLILLALVTRAFGMPLKDFITSSPR